MEKDMLGVIKKHHSLLISELNELALEEINKQFDFRYSYDAVGLEGKNKIPYEEVAQLIQTGYILQYSEREKKEILNHYMTFRHICDLVNKNLELDEEKLKDLHEMLVHGIIDGGVYRNVNIQIYGAKHQPPDYVKVYDRMKKLFTTLDTMEDSIEKAVYAHASIAKIHPFLDGNGRLARLVMNYYLLKAGYLAVSIPISKREDYIKHLETFKVEKEQSPFVDFVKQLLVERYNNDIAKLEG